MNIDVSKLPKYESETIPKCIFAMASSGDYTLEQAITVYTLACTRCKQVLLQKYLKGSHGYFEHSLAWKDAGTECEFCAESISDGDNKGDHEPKGIESFALDSIPILMPLNSIEIDADSHLSLSKLYIDNFDITHRIAKWPTDLILEYTIVSKRVILKRASFRYMHSGYGWSLKWDNDGIFKINANNNHYTGFDGSDIIKDINNNIGLKGWKDYFDLPEIKEYLLKEFNIDTTTLWEDEEKDKETPISNPDISFPYTKFNIESINLGSIDNPLYPISWICDISNIITHRIESMNRNEMIFFYIIDGYQLTLYRCMYQNRELDIVYNLQWNADSYKLYCEANPSIMYNCMFKSWDDYFKIKEVRDYLNKNYMNIAEVNSYLSQLTHKERSFI